MFTYQIMKNNACFSLNSSGPPAVEPAPRPHARRFNNQCSNATETYGNKMTTLES